MEGIIIMASSILPEITAAEASETLLNFSINRNELSEILNGFPENVEVNRVAVEYELQLLKIVFVGWAISYFSHNHPLKQQLTETFWNAAQTFSTRLSSMTSTSTGHELDYFKIITERLDGYLQALAEVPETTPPAAVVGYHFSKFCEHEGEPYTIIAGKKMFNFAVGGVKHYLESVQLIETV